MLSQFLLHRVGPFCSDSRSFPPAVRGGGEADEGILVEVKVMSLCGMADNPNARLASGCALCSPYRYVLG